MAEKNAKTVNILQIWSPVINTNATTVIQLNRVLGFGFNNHQPMSVELWPIPVVINVNSKTPTEYTDTFSGLFWSNMSVESEVSFCIASITLKICQKYLCRCFLLYIKLGYARPRLLSCIMTIKIFPLDPLSLGF